MTINNLQQAFIIHRRQHGETSFILDVFTQESGRLSILAKGARGKRSSFKGILQPFVPLLISFTGKSSLKVLTKAEAVSIGLPLDGVNLYCGFYINELLTRVLGFDLDSRNLFQHYLRCLTALSLPDVKTEIILRTFEFNLLQILGYGFDFLHCYGSGEEVSDSMNYNFHSEHGFIASMIKNNTSFSGKALKAFAVQNFSDPEIRQAAKRFIRLALMPHIGSKPLKSRELFMQFSALKNA